MNISKLKDCFGCGVCAASCSRKIIDMRLNACGFYEPVITSPQMCTDCGLCVDVCAFSHDDYALKKRNIQAYGAWSKEHTVRRKCSSGGVGFEVGRYLISQGYKVVGCRYDADKGRAEHYIASTVEELIHSIGSKYIQSYTADAFKAINRKEKYLVVGTPCQIESFRRYIQKFRCEDKFVLMDFFCHAVPSMLAWKQYTAIVEQKVGKLTYVSWRNKQTGWHDSWAMAIDGEKRSIHSRLSDGDIFYKLFLGDFCSNPACRKNCRFKYDKSSADIRIGDAWGKTYGKNEDGVSTAIAFTEKGNEILHCCHIELESHSFERVTEGQMKKNCGKAPLAFIAEIMLHSDIRYPIWMWKILIKTNMIFKKIKVKWS